MGRGFQISKSREREWKEIGDGAELRNLKIQRSVEGNRWWCEGQKLSKIASRRGREVSGWELVYEMVED